MKIFLWILFILILFQPKAYGNLLSPNTGTIVITYQTNQTGKRLDRIRFWLINEKQERTLYPKKNEFVSNSHTPNERTVVITHLPLGKYRIEFLVPNADKLFEDIPPRDVILTAGEVVKIDQSIPTRPTPKSIYKDSKEIAQGPIRPNFPPPPSFNPYTPATRAVGNFSLTSNQQTAWRLVLQDRIIYEGRGSMANIVVPPGEKYLIQAEEISGYSFYTTPQIPFNILPNANVKMILEYRRNTGRVTLKGEVPSQVTNFDIILYPQEPGYVPRRISIAPINGLVLWESGPLPIGDYILSYNIPNIPTRIENQRFVIENNFNTILQMPTLIKKGGLEILSDNPQALYTLKTEKGAVIGQGRGSNYFFKDLDDGYYIIQFSSSDPNIVPSNPSQQIFVSHNQIVQVKIDYLKLGNIIIKSNNPVRIIIHSAANHKEISKDLTHPHPSETIRLPEGVYQLTYQLTAEKSMPSQPIEIFIDAKMPKTITIPSFPPSSASDKEDEISKKGIEVNANISDASFTLHDLNSLKTTSFRGKTTFIPLQQGSFLLVFDPVPNYQIPEPISITREADDYTKIEVVYVPGVALLKVPAGIAIIGDPFLDDQENERPPKEIYLPLFEISAFEITNRQFAEWLNKAFKEQKLILGKDELEGHILNLNGKIVCKTLTANPHSQLTLHNEKDLILIAPVPDKDTHPVIEVTWHGAQAFCQDNGFRLPTESEWEKAAGMSLPNNDKPRRFRYGFGKDTIDRSWANYKEVDIPLHAIHVLTTPVGFYNGINTLPLTARDRTLLNTHLARSPVGAFDMSGNVWEWVVQDSDEKNPSQQIIKGGCYDSLAQGVRVAERLHLSPDHSDIYTGFRVAR